MTLTKQENKEIEKQVEKLRDTFFASLWDIVDDMYFADMKKQEITKLLIRDIKIGINIEYKELRTEFPNHVNPGCRCYQQ